jgi:pimeloyl-ACP methyl ester carboxylesterase
MARKFFLPGAGASAGFWQLVIDGLPSDWDCHSFSWPGLGNEPSHPDIRCLDDLVSLVVDKLAGPTDLIAQSMGGLIALKAALRAPHNIRRMVLTGTSGGVRVESFGGEDWRSAYRHEFPNAAAWITQVHEDLTSLLPTLGAPTLLLWGDRDSVSPVSVGERLAELLPHASLKIIEGGGHDFPETHATEVARLVRQHLT